MNQFSERLEKRQLFLTCAMTALYLQDKTREAVKREWCLDDDEINALEIKSVPNLVFNLVVSNEMRKQLGEPFDSVKNTAFSEFFFTGNLWILNVPSRFADTGVIVPVRDHARRFIKCLQVFRHVKDSSPFILGKF